MIATIHKGNTPFTVDFSKPIDISIPVRAADDATRAWYVNPPVIEPVRMGDWVASVEKGSSVNFYNIFFNPHAHGTHTECVGHISPQKESIHVHLKQYMFFAALITVTPEIINGDAVITAAQITKFLQEYDAIEALIIRTNPNDEQKLHINYSDTNPAFIHHDAIHILNEKGVRHLLIDTPSVDKEKDEGLLLAHKAFWNYPEDIQYDKTITEMVYIPTEVVDGMYLLNLQIGAIDNDAAPSKPVLYALK
jgi:kynurenine formamidase